MATSFSPCKGSYVLNQFPSNVMFAMNGFTYQPVERYRAIMALLLKETILHILLKSMRLLEEVIQNKILVRKGVNRSYILDHNYLTDDIPIYTIDNMEIDNMVDLLKLITPLLYHLISILKQERENRETHLLIEL